MSLDFANKTGLAFATSLYSGALGAIVATVFDGGAGADNASVLRLDFDTAGGDVDLNGLPTTLTASDGSEVLVDGLQLVCIKGTFDASKLVFTDPIFGYVYAFVNQQSEAITLTFSDDGVTRQWVFNG